MSQDDDSWRDYDHGFRDGYQSALREHPGFVSVAEIKALLPRVYDGTHLVDCPYVGVLMRIREALLHAVKP